MQEIAPRLPCSDFDTACACRNDDASSALTACVLRNCAIDDALRAQQYVIRLCDAAEHDDTQTAAGAIAVLSALALLGVVLYFVSRFVYLKEAFLWTDAFVVLLTATNVAYVSLLVVGRFLLPSHITTRVC